MSLAAPISASAEQVDILLVDDTPANLMALEAILTRKGQNIIKASSGKEALKILLKQDFALILLDINMPCMSGFETASLIRQRKNSEHTPIIFITAFGSSENDRALSYSLGAVDYIYSPVVPEVLLTKVSVFVELYKKTAQIKKLNESLKMHASILEQKVWERTAALSQVNEDLKKEIKDRELVERKLVTANKELTRLSKIKSEFTSMVSHELRTPLNCIKAGIDLVLDGVDGPLNAEQSNTLSISKANVDRLAKLIQNVLDFSKLESGKMTAFFETYNLRDLVKEVYALMHPVTQHKGIIFACSLPEDDLTVTCDADKIKQLLINLLDNAIKFTNKKGSIVVRLYKKKKMVHIEVEDTGVGIKKSDHEKIFEMFAQVPSCETRQTGGVGIGLAVCKQIALLHHGELTVESTHGKGSRFLLQFPAELHAPPSDLPVLQKQTG